MKSILVKDHMSRKVQSVALNQDILAATHFLVQGGISGAPVLDEHGRLVGILTERDCMRVALHSGYHETPYGLVRDYMTPNPESVTPEQSILTVADKFLQGTYRRYPVVDNGRLVGIISRRDALCAIVSKSGDCPKTP